MIACVSLVAGLGDFVASTGVEPSEIIVTSAKHLHLATNERLSVKNQTNGYTAWIDEKNGDVKVNDR